jgi:hypothetical protein
VRSAVVRNRRTVVGYCCFMLLLVLATYPAWRVLVFGFSIDDLLQLRSFHSREAGFLGG